MHSYHGQAFLQLVLSTLLIPKTLYVVEYYTQRLQSEARLQQMKLATDVPAAPTFSKSATTDWTSSIKPRRTTGHVTTLLQSICGPCLVWQLSCSGRI